MNLDTGLHELRPILIIPRRERVRALAVISFLVINDTKNKKFNLVFLDFNFIKQYFISLKVRPRELRQKACIKKL